MTHSLKDIQTLAGLTEERSYDVPARVSLRISIKHFSETIATYRYLVRKLKKEDAAQNAEAIKHMNLAIKHMNEAKASLEVANFKLNGKG